ncbi:MAG: GAF domain-containing protein [Bacteroidales bacterium]
MAEHLNVDMLLSKEEKYKALLPQIGALIESETDLIANMANITAAIKEVFGFFWIGFYRVENDILLLGPFQGPIACTRIKYGKGVCGTSWKDKKTLVVPDVELFPGHIACSSLSRSEIVVPVIRNNDVVAVLDVDSDRINEFDEIDSFYLNEICNLLNR